MLKRKNRLTNLNHVRQDISLRLNELMAQHNVSLDELAIITNWSLLYLKALAEGQATPDIGGLNYIASIFDLKLKVEFAE